MVKWMGREGGPGQTLMSCSDAPSKKKQKKTLLEKDTPTAPERKAARGFLQRWHSQVPAQNAAAAATMGRNYGPSTRPVSDALMALSPARSGERAEKFSLRRFRSGAF